MYNLPAPPPHPYIPPTYTTFPTITPTYILPTFMGRQQIPAVPLFPHQVSPTTTLFPSTPTPTETSVVTIVEISRTETVKINGNASIKIQTLPNLQCKISYTTPLGNQSVAQGLGTVISDKDGYCSWTWLIGSNTEPGTGTITITVGNTTINFSIQIE